MPEPQLHALRRYPHNGVMQFLAENFPTTKGVHVLDAGCGSGSNLWAIANEGFDAFGIDTSACALENCRQVLEMWGAKAELIRGNMAEQIPFQNRSFDAVVDVFASYSLKEKEFERFLREVACILRPAGKFYCWNPSTASGAFHHRAPGALIEPYTLDMIHRNDAPFTGNGPFRFLRETYVPDIFWECGLKVLSIARDTRTYNDGSEVFEWLEIVAERGPFQPILRPMGD